MPDDSPSPSPPSAPSTAPAKTARAALRIEISPQFEYALSIDDAKEGDFKVDVGGITVLFDRQSAARADGLSVDFLETDDGGFKIENPNEPPRVRQLSVQAAQGAARQGRRSSCSTCAPRTSAPRR